MNLASSAPDLDSAVRTVPLRHRLGTATSLAVTYGNGHLFGTAVS
jgi:hypothetical protein